MISVIGDSFTSGVGYTPWCDLLQEKLNTKVVNLNRQDMLTEPNVTSTNFFMMDRLEEFEMILQVSDLFIFQWTAPLRDDEDEQGDGVNYSNHLDKREVELMDKVWYRLESLNFNCPMVFWSWRDFSHLNLKWYDKLDCGIKWPDETGHKLHISKSDSHPNQDGHEWISEEILSFVKKKNYL